MSEAAGYALDGNGIARLHFTVSPEHIQAVGKHLEEVRGRYERSGVKFLVDLSIQKPSTDTLAVDLNNQPLRDGEGRLVFRPGGHGALLENLNDLKGDIVFIKNIDNVVPDSARGETYLYKKALCGYLLVLQKQIHGYLERLSGRDVSEPLLGEVFEFIRSGLSIVLPPGIGQKSVEERRRVLFSKLNRPLRVCGMVKVQGEPGGSPNWGGYGESESLQIVESSQVDMESSEQRGIFMSATHFNPVDIVCGVCDHLGRAFDLTRFADPTACFISTKSMDGKKLKALELPGLWNGAMADWNTVFVEVPGSTFNPVKTVFDLLREEHQEKA
jgi:hypothetical protein